jgi:hypothetical protein
MNRPASAPVIAIDPPKIHDYLKVRILSPLPGAFAYRAVAVQLSHPVDFK